MALKDGFQQAGEGVKSTVSSARENVSNRAGDAASRVRSTKVLGGLIELITSFAGAFRQVGGDVFNKNNASQGVNGAKTVGRGIGSIGSAIMSIGDKGLRGLGAGAKNHPYLAVISALLLGGSFFKAWRNDRAAKQQAEMPPQAPMPPQYYGTASQADMAGPTGQNVQRFAPNGPVVPGQSHNPMGPNQPGQRF